MAQRTATVARQRTAISTPESGPASLSIGALARASGVPVATLRTWARRYGFPSAEGRPAGQRLFPIAHVERLRLIRRALALGHRAAQALSASPVELGRMLSLGPTLDEARPAPPMPADVDAALLQCVAQLDGERLTRLLLEEWARLTLVEFLTGRIAPLLTSVGEKWHRGDLGIHHEHFLTARLSDLLGGLRQPLERDSDGPMIALATLPGEHHTLGLSMVALVLAHAGFRLLFLGAECPPGEIGEAARGQHACAVAVSVSRASRGRRSERLLRELRSALPRSVRLLVGGLGASAPPGAERLGSLPELVQWARRQRGIGV
jgi:MerR family transcriptional regulator, light-induced transcriptional regulator